MRPSPEREAGGRLDYRRLIALIDALPERRRRIVRMRKLDGYSQREISQQLGVSESIVENEIHQGVRAVLRAWRDGAARAEARLTQFEGGERRPGPGTAPTQSPNKPRAISPRVTATIGRNLVNTGCTHRPP